MLIIHSIGLYYRVLEFKGVFAPQYTINGSQWHYFFVVKTPVELSSLELAKQYINQSI